MRTVSYRVEVALDAAAAWRRLGDFSLALHYVPGLTGLEITSEARSGVGASRRVRAGARLCMDETVVDWREGEGYSIRLHRGEAGPPPPLAEARFDYALEERGGRVFLHNSMRYSVGLGPLGRLLDWLALSRVARRNVRDVTIAQKLFYETGAKPSREALAAARAALPG